MCELFGLSSNRPVPPGELLYRLGARGVDTAGNPDNDLPCIKSIVSDTGRLAPLKNGGSP
jgi:hypothetical protein